MTAAAMLCGLLETKRGMAADHARSRIEKRNGGEDRFVRPAVPGGVGAGYLQFNRNKRAMTLDTTLDEGRTRISKHRTWSAMAIITKPT